MPRGIGDGGEEKDQGATAWLAVAVVATAMWALAGCEVWQSSDDGGVKITPPPKVEPNVAPPESPVAEQSAVNFFEEGKIHEVRLWMSDEDFTSIIQDTRGDELRSATFSINGVVMANVGIRPSGESSRVPGNQKMSMRVEFAGFDKGKRMGGFDEIKLSGSWDDPFIVRDRLAYWLYRQVMPAPREVPAQLWINGQPRGIFEIEEVWGKEALASRFADPNGPLYRLRGLTNTDPYAYQGTDTTQVRAAALGSEGDDRSGDGGRADRQRAARGQRRAGAPRRGDGHRHAADLLRRQRDRVQHRRLHGAVRGRRSLPVLRSADWEVRRSCRGIRTTRSDRSTTCPTPTST